MTKLPDPNSIGDDTLLRLGVAAALEFPDGSMGASGLRREALHGRLRIWRIAGKDYTTRQALKEMSGLCVLSNHHDSSYAAPARPPRDLGHQGPRAGNQHRRWPKRPRQS
jgi:hypothetical protein